MRFIIFIVLALFCGSVAAGASSPGMVEGPPGCTWLATVSEVTDTQVTVHLDALYGTCMADGGACGKEGNTLSIAKSVSGSSIKSGFAVQVWVDTDKDGTLRASLDKPPCTTTPISDETLKTRCEQTGGRWEGNEQGRGRLTGCNMPTKDGGKTCKTGDDCESVCLKDQTCYGWNMFKGCASFKGHEGIVCIE